MRHRKNKFLSALQNFIQSMFILPFGRRLIFFASIFSVLFLFFPWFVVQDISMNAFEKISIFGYIIFLTSIFSFLLVLREIFSQKSFLGKISHGTIFIFLFAQGLYTLFIANFVFSSFLLENSSAELGNGIMLTFVAMGIGLAGSLFSKEFRLEKKQNIYMETKEVNTDIVSMKPEKKLSLGDYEDRS